VATSPTPEERARTICDCGDCGHRPNEWCNADAIAAALRAAHASGLREGAEIAESHGRRVAAAASVMRARAEEVERSE
jgi:hypothetical protein